eukprot:6009578-Amphidinium_carterae.1
MEAIELRNIQDAYTEDVILDDIIYRDQKYPTQPTDEDQYELAEYLEMNLAIRKKRDEITSVSQTLNYVL